MLKAIQQRNVFLLWLGQLMSSIGDEVYRVAFVWMSVSFVGADTGFLVGCQVFAVLMVTLFGGRWADHWNPYRTMIKMDLFRAFLILIPVAVTLLFQLSYPVLWITAVVMAGLGGFFDPALQSVLPEQCKDARTLRGANGLMSTTIRTARVVAPLIIGLLTALIPPIHFFSLNALSFLISAYTIYLLFKSPKPNPHAHAPIEKFGPTRSFTTTINSLRKHPAVERAVYLKAMMAGAWWVGYFLGLVLLVKQKFAGDLKAYGFVLSVYGVGNLASAIIFGSQERKNQHRQMYLGFLVLAFGFIGMSLAPNLFWLALAGAFTALSGPINDLPFMDLLQNHFKGAELGRVFRYKLATETGSALVGFLVAPQLFTWFPAANVMLGLGLWILILGLYGLRRLA